MSTVTTVAQYLEVVRKSGLVEGQRLQAYLKPLEANARLPEEPRKMAALLVRDGLLTNYQAVQLLHGKYKGFVIAGKFKLLEILGNGGMGRVFLCEHILMQRLAALKIVPTDPKKDAARVERLYREARAVAALDHPNIVRAYDVDRSDNLLFLVMEFVDGSDLKQVVAKNGPLDIHRAAQYISQAACGLQHAHEAGWVHRDVKPSNLLLDRHGTIKLLDLGLARLFNHPAGGPGSDHEDKNTVVGTADYLSPEQALNSREVDIRADIYSLGATFYFLLSGQSPFGDGSVAQKLTWHQMRQPPSVRELRPDVPQEMAAIITRMMKKKPSQRFQEPAEVMAALEPWTETPCPEPAEEEMPKWAAAITQFCQANPSSGGSSLFRYRAAQPAAKPKSLPPIKLPRRLVTVARSRLGSVALAAGLVLLIVSGLAAGIWSYLQRKEAAPYTQVADDSRRQTPPEPTPRPPQPVREVVHPVAEADKLYVAQNPEPNLAGKKHVFGTVQLALGQARAGCQIVVLDPIIQEQLVLDGGKLGKGVSIVSGLPSGQSVIWRPPTARVPNTPLLRAANVAEFTLHGFQFDGNNEVEDLLAFSGRCPGLRLDNLLLTQFKRRAITLTNCVGEKDRPVTLSFLRVLGEWKVPGKMALVIESREPESEATINQHLVIRDSRFEGLFDPVVHLAGSVIEMDFIRNRIWGSKESELQAWKSDTILCKSARPGQQVRLTIASNTYCRVNSCLHFDTLPPMNGKNQVLLRNNLLIGSQALVSVDSTPAPSDAQALMLFPDLAGNVTRPGAPYCPKGLFRTKLERVSFGYLDILPESDSKFLRYKKDSLLYTAGANKEPVGVPPVEE